jgi:hypothetical protein
MVELLIQFSATDTDIGAIRGSLCSLAATTHAAPTLEVDAFNARYIAVCIRRTSSMLSKRWAHVNSAAPNYRKQPEGLVFKLNV